MGIQTKCLQQNKWDLLSYWGKIFGLLARARITLFNITPNNHSIYTTNYHSQRILCRILESPQKHFWRIVLINAYSPDFLSLTRLLCKASSCGLSTARLISMKGWLGCSQSLRPTNFSGKSQQTTPTLAILRLEWISFLFEQVWNWKCLIYKVWTSDRLPKNTSIPRLPHITGS